MKVGMTHVNQCMYYYVGYSGREFWLEMNLPNVEHIIIDMHS